MTGESAADSGQEHSGEGHPKATRDIHYNETEGQEQGSGRHQPMGRAAVHPEARAYDEQGPQGHCGDEQSVPKKGNVQPVVRNQQRFESAGTPDIQE